MATSGFEDVAELVLTAVHRVCRLRRAGSAGSVLFKAVRQGSVRWSDPEGLAREYALLRELAIPGVARPLELVRDGAGGRLVLEDHGLESLGARIARGDRPDLASFLRLAISLCTAMGELHRRDIVHNAIAPASILIAPDWASIELFEFSLARRLPVDSRSLASDALALGLAPYMAPEQTGRMNRPVDHRADLYGLGATLYEVLTGRPPFGTGDPLELVHAHIAKGVVPASVICPEVPEQVSALVQRLLAKAAEDRYQSAAGVRHDLERCLAEWATSARIAAFPLGRRDVADRFLIPQRLYGRDAELLQLTSAFQDAQDGRTILFLVSGYSGIGKTSFIHELCKPMARPRGYFITGKFDQVARNIPYGALIQAFRGLFWLVLAESEDRLSTCRAELTATLGVNAGVIAEVIPELEFIIGKQPPPPRLEPTEALNRFRYVFENFVSAFARPGEPLVIFLDDLQWADAATLDLLRSLATGDKKHLLIIGAFRDNEVGPAHALTLALERIRTSGADVRRVELGSLALTDLVAFLADTLRCPAAETAELAQLIEQKTGGNPFFVIQFLKALHQDKHIAFDYEHGRWVWRTEAIVGIGITDNVVVLMTWRIQRLSSDAQHVLRLAACIGSPFTAHTLFTASGRSADETEAGLAEALEAGLVEPVLVAYALTDAEPRSQRSYAFIHDRVQQAAYSLIPEAQRASTHLEVGRLLLGEFGEEVPDECLFEIVNHLDVGLTLIAGAERRRVARLNLRAGRKARTSTAYQAACEYFLAASALLADDDFASDYELAFAVHLEAGESQYLAGHFDEALLSFDRLLPRATTARDRASVHALKAVAHENMSRYAESVASGRDGLALFGITLPDSPPQLRAAIDSELAAIRGHLDGRTIGSLIDLPVMTDTDTQMIMRILTSIWAPAYITGNEMQARFISATMVRLSLTHGNTEDSAYGYVTHAITVGPVRGDFQAAYEWGQLALSVNERFADAKRRAKIHQQIHAHVKLWSRPLSSCIPHAREAHRSGLETGDFAYAGYGAATESWPAFVINRDLDAFVREHSPALDLLTKIQMLGFRDALRLLLNWALALQGRTEGRCSLSDRDFDEDAYQDRYRETAPLLLTLFNTAKLHLSVIQEDVALGVEFARRAREITVAGTIWPVLADFWGALALAAAYATATDDTRTLSRESIMSAESALARLGESCPENYRCFGLLVSAERARIEARPREAKALYDGALRYAELTDNLQMEALAGELAARSLKAQGNPSLASHYLQAAYRCYEQWGAFGKLRQMEDKYGLEPTHGRIGESVPKVAIAAVDGDSTTSFLDVRSVIKVARAIASEMELDRLLDNVMRIALENAGAEWGAFLQDSDGRITARIEAAIHESEIVLTRPPAGARLDVLPQTVARYVLRTGQDVRVGEVASDERFVDAARANARARSVLCVRLEHQGRSEGVLYLENGMSNAFRPDRTEVVRVLAAQAAVSLENARLYDEMRKLKNRLEAENVYLQEEIGGQHNFKEIVGRSPALLEALRRVELVAPTESTVLILGETGSGKELFARAVHSCSKRRARALVKVNCGAIAPGLVESELFGHVKGAFTGAIDKRVGRFELANGGTIFLDEVGELPAEAQVKLLRVLQEQEFEPVGSSRTVRTDVRVIAATNRNLEQAVREGRFRADLLYRLNVVPIAVPPLRERPSDIPMLIGFFVAALSRKLGKPFQGFSPTSLATMMRYPWPGNVRELANVVERAAILATRPLLEVEPMLDPRAPATASANATAGQSMDDMQRAHIRDVLRRTGGVVEGASGAAAILGMHPNTLRSRMKKLGISGASRATEEA